MKIIKRNKKANFNYFLIKIYIAGVILSGAEVKEVKAGHIDLTGSFARVKGDEVFLWNAVVSRSIYAEIDSNREKKLLLHKREIKEIKKSLEQKSLTLIPVVVGLDHGLIKVEIALARGKKLYDKRDAIKARENEKRIRIMMMPKNMKGKR